MAQLGRISGPLLSDNLLRNGSDLAFETNLLYLNVTGKYIGVKTNGATNDLSVNGTTATTELIVDTYAALGNLDISGYQIQNPISSITFSPNQSSNPTVVAPIIQTPNLQITSNVISNLVSNDNITITAAGGTSINSNTLVNGGLHATGNITWDGNIQLGNATTDTIDFAGEVNSNILPNLTNTYDLGSSTHNWSTVYVTNLTINQPVNLNTSGLTSLLSGNISAVGNSITTTSGGLTFTTSGTGTNKITSNGLTLKIVGNTWTPDPSSNAFHIASTLDGYTSFASAKAIVTPTGTTVQRPSAPVVGMIRYNTNLHYEEVYNGTSWIPAIGAGGAVTQTQVDDIMNIWSLILG